MVKIDEKAALVTVFKTI